MKNNEKRGKPTKWNLSFQRAAIDLTLDCCEIWQRFKTRDVEKTNKSKRERETENMSKASIYDDPRVQTAVYFRLAKNPVSRKISFNMNPTAERSIGWFPKWHYRAMSPRDHESWSRDDENIPCQWKQTELHVILWSKW